MGLQGKPSSQGLGTAQGLAGSRWVACGPCVATTSGKVTVHLPLCLRLGVWRGSRRFLQLTPAWSRTPAGGCRSGGLEVVRCSA